MYASLNDIMFDTILFGILIIVCYISFLGYTNFVLVLYLVLIN